MGGFQGTPINVGNIRQFNPSDNLTAANKLFSNISERVRGRAISKVLGETQLDSNDILGSQDTLRSNLVRAGATPMEALGLVNKAITPYADQRAYDRGVFTSDRNYGLAQGRLGLAGAGLAERRRHNGIMENKPSAAGMPNTKTIVDENPYTGAKTYYQYNSKDANPTFTPVDMGPQSSIGTEQPIDTVAMNDVVDTNAQPQVALTDTAQPGAYEQNFIAQAEANPIDVARANTPVAGVGAGMPQPVTPGVTFGKPDRYGVSQGSDGTFRSQDGNYVIPLNMRETKEIKLADGTTSYVVINKATGRDASGNAVGDEGQTTWSHQTVSLPNGQSKREVIGIKPDGTSVTMENGKEVPYKSGTKEPTLLQKDKQYIDSLGSVTPAMNRVGTAIKRDKDIFGPIADWFDKKQHDDDTINFSGIGQLFGTDDSKLAARFDSDTSRMMSKVIKSLGANPSDRDLKLLEAQVPQRSDEPSTAKMKLESFKELFYDIQAGTFSRLISSNPSALDGKAIPEEVANRLYNSLPQGFKLQKNADTGQIRVIRVGG